MKRFKKINIFNINQIAKSLSGSKWKNIEAKTKEGSGK
jgi:hypothetical protein